MSSEYTGYTDGACRVSNPGLGSCAYVVYHEVLSRTIIPLG